MGSRMAPSRLLGIVVLVMLAAMSFLTTSRAIAKISF